MEVADINEENRGSSSSRRNQKRHSLSSILKASPSRQALSDLDANRKEDTDVIFPNSKQEKRKKRRSSKRVSFANTHEVKEFLKEKDARELGIFETSRDGSNQKEDERRAASTGSQGQPFTTNLPGSSVGPGHNITGLDTLLTAPIVQPSQSTGTTQPDSAADERSATINKFLQDLRDQEEASSNPDKKPFFDFTPEPAKEEETGGTMIQFLKTLSFFNDPREEPEEGHTMTKIVSLFGDDVDNFEREDREESQSVATTTDRTTKSTSGDQELAGEQNEKTIFFQADVNSQSGNMEMTRCYDHTIHQEQIDGTSTSEPMQQMKMQYCDTLGLLGPTYTCRIPSCDSSDSISLHSSCLHNSSHISNLSSSSQENIPEGHLQPDGGDDKTRVFTQEDASANMEMTTCLPQASGVMSSDSSKGQKEGIKRSMTGIDVNNTLTPQGSCSSTVPDQECTQIFGQSDKTSNMELTTCISLVGKNSSVEMDQSNRQSGKLFQFASEPGFEEKTRLYGQDDVTLGMDLTEPIPAGSNVEGANYPSSDEKMKIHTADSAVKGNQLHSLSGMSLQPSDEAGCEEKTKLFGRNDTTAGMDLTEPVPTGSSVRRANQTCSNEKTRIFSKDSAMTAMDMTSCGHTGDLQLVSERLSSSKSMDVEDKTVVFGENGPSGDVDLTECLETLTKQNADMIERDAPQHHEKDRLSCTSENITQSHDMAQSDHTKLYSKKDGEMEMTECVDGDVLRDVKDKGTPALKSGGYLPHQTDRKEQTILFKEQDMTAGMDLTECLEGAQLEGMEETGESRGKDTGPEETLRRSDDLPSGMHHAQMVMNQFSEQDKENVPVPLLEPTENTTLRDIDLSKIQEGPLDSTHIFPHDHLGRRSAFFPSSALKQKADVSMDISITDDPSHCPTDPPQKIVGAGKAAIDSSKKSNQALLSIKSRIARMDQAKNSKAKMALFQQADSCGRSQLSSITESTKQDGTVDAEDMKISQGSSEAKPEYGEERTRRLLETIDELPSMLLNTTSSAKYSSTTLNDDLLNSTNGTPARINNRSLKRPHSKSLPGHDALEGPATKLTVNQEDGKMVITGVGNQNYDGKAEKESHQPDHDDNVTRKFGPDDGEGMELTSCVEDCIQSERDKENILPEICGSSQSVPMGKVSMIASNIDEEQTRRFLTDDTGKMEFTSCLTSNVHVEIGKESMPPATQSAFIPDLPGNINCSSSLKRAFASEDHTRRFESENTGNMELTTCATGKFEMLSEHMIKHVSREGLTQGADQTAKDDRTRRFESEAANMEFTTSLAGNIEGGQDNEMMQSMSRLLLEDARMSQPLGMNQQEHTKMFKTDDTGGMELTSCVEPRVEQNVNQESCHKTVITRNETDSELPERTQIFQEGSTERMELTNVYFKSDLSEGHVDGSPPCKKAKPMVNPADDLTRIFISENTGNMDMTSCMTGQIQVMDSSRQTKVNNMESSHRESVSECKPENSAEKEGKTIQSGLEEIPGTDDIKVNDRSKVEVSESKEHLNTSVSIKKRDSETFTLEKSQFDLPDITDQVEEAEKGSPGAPEVDTSVPSTSAAGQPNLSMTDSRLLMPEWPMDMSANGIMDETEFLSPECTEDLEVLALGKTSFKDTSGVNLSTIPNTSAAAEGVKDLEGAASGPTEDKSAPKDVTVSESLTVAEYFKLFHTSSDAAEDANFERETLVAVDLKKPEELEDFLQVLFVTKPNQEIHDWAITELQTKLTKLTGALQTQASQLLKDKYPSIFEKLKDQSTTQKTYNDLQQLHNYCLKFSRNQFYVWDLKMKSRLKEEMKYGIEKLGPKVAKTSEGLERLDAKLKELDEVSVDLDQAISSFQEIQLPKKEEQEDFIKNEEKLSQLETENVTTNENIQLLEREKLFLIARKNELLKEQEILDEKLLGVSSTETEEEANAKNKEFMELTKKMTTLHSLQEWVLESMSPTGDKLHFSFLNGSLDTTVEYECVTGLPTKLKELSLRSFLPEDGCPIAKLIHRLILQALKVDELKTMHSCYSSLPLLLQHISEIVIRGRQLEMEIRHIDFWHITDVQDCSLQVEFSSVRAHAKLLVTFNLNLNSYPHDAILTSKVIEIGQIKEKEVQGAMDQAKPGSKQLTQLVQHLDCLLQVPVSPDPLS